MTSSSRQTDRQLESIVNEPLHTGQGTNHEDSHRQTVPKTLETNSLVDSLHGLQSGLAGLLLTVDLGDHDVGGVGNDGTQNTGQVTSGKGDSNLLGGGEVLLGLSEILVDLLDNLLERSKLDHGVGDLSEPEGTQTLPETAQTLGGDNLLPAVNRPLAKGGMVVWVRTLMASQGHRKMSAINSAVAEAARNTPVLYLDA